MCLTVLKHYLTYESRILNLISEEMYTCIESRNRNQHHPIGRSVCSLLSNRNFTGKYVTVLYTECCLSFQCINKTPKLILHMDSNQFVNYPEQFAFGARSQAMLPFDKETRIRGRPEIT